MSRVRSSLVAGSRIATTATSRLTLANHVHPLRAVCPVGRWNQVRSMSGDLQHELEKHLSSSDRGRAHHERTIEKTLKKMNLTVAAKSSKKVKDTLVTQWVLREPLKIGIFLSDEDVLKLRVGFKRPEQLVHARAMILANELNEARRFVKTYIDDDKDIVVDMDAPLAAVGEPHVHHLLSIFIRQLVEIFAELKKEVGHEDSPFGRDSFDPIDPKLKWVHQPYM
ncbi:unnamed protein product [Symbiodinium sp. CCMP2456]|nr:unnamed protein product [Symbiodinium sp. CCMP2456]